MRVLAGNREGETNITAITLKTLVMLSASEVKPGVEGPIAVTTGLNLESISGMDRLKNRIKWPGVEMPSQAAGAASRHGMLTPLGFASLRSA